WDAIQYDDCSVSCGGGVQQAVIECIQILATGSGNTIRVPEDFCTEPKPNITKMCNHIDCPPNWEVTEWSECSQSCGDGIQSRDVSCKQLLALGNKIDIPDVFCVEDNPANQQPCNTQSCPAYWRTPSRTEDVCVIVTRLHSNHIDAVQYGHDAPRH
ncbi:ADAMTS-like protein 1, partial [Saccoglossus kowalevskii]